MTTAAVFGVNSSASRPGFWLRESQVAVSSRSYRGVPGSEWRISVVFPVWRGPSRKWDFFASSPGRSRTRGTKIDAVGIVVIYPVK